MSADFQVGRIVSFQTGRLLDAVRPADLEIGDTARYGRFGNLRDSAGIHESLKR
jgi:hypothetical protein